MVSWKIYLSLTFSFSPASFDKAHIKLGGLTVVAKYPFTVDEMVSQQEVDYELVCDYPYIGGRFKVCNRHTEEEDE